MGISDEPSTSQLLKENPVPCSWLLTVESIIYKLVIK